ncbi:MAG: TonB-dependent receptor, partial [Carboxylicivirga sp.]|nr:TonB-dependent receptor [Carboxylicivirga sp.]
PVTGAENVSGEDLTPEVDQRFSSFDLGIGLRNNNNDERKTTWVSGFNFNTFGTKTGVKQNGFGLSGGLLHPLNNLTFGIDGEIRSYKTNVPDTIGPMYTFNDRSQTLISVNPSANFLFDNASLRVGLSVNGLIDSEDDEFYLSPDILGQLTVVEGIVSLYGGVNGKVKMNDLRSVMYENNFASADVNVKSSFYGINLFAGIKGNFSSAASFSAGVEYGMFENEHFWVNKYYGANVPASTGLNGVAGIYSNQFDVVYDDGSLLTVKGELLLNPKKDMEFALRGAYYGWSLDELDEAWHKPEMKFGASGQFSPMEGLLVKAGVDVLGERKALDVSATNGDLIKKLKTVVDINLGAEYHFSKQWSFWANVNNVAASKYYKWNGYPMQGLNMKAGIIYSF